LSTLIDGAARKNLAGPPEEFPNFKLPTPEESAIEETSAVLEIRFQDDATNATRSLWSAKLPVDSVELFAFSIFSPQAASFHIKLYDPTGTEVDLKSHQTKSGPSSYPIGLGHIPGHGYSFEKPQIGDYKLAIFVPRFKRPTSTFEPDGIVLLFNKSPIRQHSSLTTYDLKLGTEIGVTARLTVDQQGTISPRALKDVVTKATMEVYDPSGNEETVQMHDDGLHADGAANDGIYGGFIPATKVGLYRAEAMLGGDHADGTHFVRSTQHLIPVVNSAITLTGLANAVKKDEDHLLVQINVQPTNSRKLFRVYTELWGTDANGASIPVCWLSGLVNVEVAATGPALSLELDVNWLKRAGAREPLALKNIVIQDVNVHIPLDTADDIPLVAAEGVVPFIESAVEMTITKKMREGAKPDITFNVSAAAPNLMLVHGYCANVNPWLSEKNDFTNAAYFLEPSKSLTNQEFADLVVAHAEELGMTRFSGIGHSQGGIVLVHILNYYHTGLDETTNGRKVQTVGTPFNGCSGAGTAANLINLFGYGCGENFDLTTDGSKLWLAGITPETKKQISYYTTTYKQGTLFGDACSYATNLVLQWPNDGTTELKHAHLVGATNMGNKEKWCHTTEMNYAPQYQDHTRNQEMNKAAGR